MKILDSLQIKNKILRMAYEIAETNFDSEKVYFLGINNNGYNFAEMLMESLESICDIKTEIARISLKPVDPANNDISVDIDIAKLNNQTVIVVDDVANTGRTLFYAMKTLMNITPAAIETAVLVDRMHKSFPININYVGLTFATTIQDNILVDLKTKGNENVNLV